MTVTRYPVTPSSSAPLGIGITLLIGALGLAKLWADAEANRIGWYQSLFWPAWFCILAFAAYRQATAAREIVVHERDEIEFIAFLTRVRISARNIRSVRLRPGRYTDVVVEHADGRVYLAGSFTRFHQFLTELEQVNPSVDVSGC
jgi:hypothetical protein